MQKLSQLFKANVAPFEAQIGDIRGVWQETAEVMGMTISGDVYAVERLERRYCSQECQQVERTQFGIDKVLLKLKVDLLETSEYRSVLYAICSDSLDHLSKLMHHIAPPLKLDRFDPWKENEQKAYDRTLVP